MQWYFIAWKYYHPFNQPPGNVIPPTVANGIINGIKTNSLVQKLLPACPGTQGRVKFLEVKLLAKGYENFNAG